MLSGERDDGGDVGARSLSETVGRPPEAPSCRAGRPALGLALALALIACAPFVPALGNGFLDLDDDENFLENVDYRGLGWPQVRWAWTTFLLGVYQPMAWMLLEGEYATWGLDPRGYHLVSLVLHAANAVVLFVLVDALLARSLPGSRPEERPTRLVASAVATACFTVHPLRVEVVAWASCQPYLPCACFAMLSILAYLRASDDDRARVGRLSVAWLLFAAALLSKAVAVTLPVVMLVLDVYPLRRIGWDFWRGPSARRVWLEKLPFFLLGLVFMILAVLAKRSNQSLISVEHYGIAPRIAQSCYGIWFYLLKTVLPFDLVAYYPMPPRRELLGARFLAGIAATLAASVAAFLLRRRRPGLLAAWACYLIILAPNLGLARIGNQIVADRYSYVASIVWVVAAAHALDRLIRPNRSRPVWASGAVAVVLILSILTWRQCQTWRTTESLWTHVLRHGSRRVAVAHFSLGAALARQGRLSEAMGQYAEALVLSPDSPDAHNLLGAALDRQGRRAEALAHYARAVRLEPEYADARNNLGVALAREGRLREAQAHLAEAVRIKPDFPLARRNLGMALADRGLFRQAIPHLAEAARLEPDRPEAHEQLGLVLAQVGRPDEAIAELTTALRLAPDSAAAHINLGLALERRGRLDEAGGHFTEAARLEPARADNHFLIGSVLARRGKLDEAAIRFSEALRLDPDHPEARRGLDEVRRAHGR